MQQYTDCETLLDTGDAVGKIWKNSINEDGYADYNFDGTFLTYDDDYYWSITADECIQTVVYSNNPYMSERRCLQYTKRSDGLAKCVLFTQVYDRPSWRDYFPGEPRTCVYGQENGSN